MWPIHHFDNNNEITLDPSVKIKKYRPNDRNMRRPVAGSLGCHIEGAACPHPDLSDPSTTLEGALYRFCPKIPGYDEHKLEFRAFVRDWCVKHLTPLPADTDTSVSTWLTNTTYTLKRKEELQQKFDNIKNVYDKQHRKVKSFVKDEFYPEYKHARAINSRTDEYKTLTGPIFQKIGDVLFARPEFIKKVPVHERPAVLLRDLYQDGASYFTTDFSSFEAHFRRVLMEDCEFQMYDHMTQFLPEHAQFMKLVLDVIGGVNEIQFKNILMEIEAKRMSGEMNTSSGNGFSNLMFLLYVCHKKNCGTIKPKIEGDDGLCSASGVPPTTEDFKEFGLRIKLGVHDDLCKASFCGMIFDKEDMTNVSDPREVLATFGWTSSKYIRSKNSIKMTLLRCKALSLAYQYPSCPILSSFAQRMLWLTRSYEVKRFVEKQGRSLFNQYEIELFLLAEKRNRQGLLLFKEPGIATRKLVEDMFSISIQDQYKIELYFQNMVAIEPITCPQILSIMEPSWIDYYAKYHAQMNPFSSNYDYPTQLWPRIKDEFSPWFFLKPLKGKSKRKNCSVQV